MEKTLVTEDRRPSTGWGKTMNAKSNAEREITVQVLRATDWPALADLFGARGACGGCWCMWWRVPRGGKLWAELKGEKNKRAFRRLVEAGEVHGVLALAGDEPVGWCAFGPRTSFPRLQRSRVLQHDRWSERTWSVVCFYVRTAWRGRGVASKLLAAATERAFALGAADVEGYPVVVHSAGTLMPAAFAYPGVPVLFERAGYRRLRRPGIARPIYRRVAGK